MLNTTYDAALSLLPSYAVPFFSLSYPLPPPEKPDSFPNASYYGLGPLDLCLFVTWIAVLGVVREFTRIVVFEPIGRWYLTRKDAEADRRRAALKQPSGVPAEKKPANGNTTAHATAQPKKLSKREQLRERCVQRFGEQGYQLAYFVIYWSYGVYLHVNFPHSPWRLDHLWIGYPHFPLAAPAKFYYLSQCAFWTHSVLVLNAEAHRADHWQMMSHHFVTISLLAASYLGNNTRVGCLILVLTDLCDIFLPLAKMTRYLGFATLCDIMFGVFMVSWIITRQILFGFVLVSTYGAPKHAPFKWDPATGYYFTRNIHAGFMVFLGMLMVMLCIWSSMMFRVAFKVIRGQTAEDSRSDDELELASDDADDDDFTTKTKDTVNAASVLEPVSPVKTKTK
ncbi:longevity assurance proteins LAG1/LAC1 [Auriculariales sp. MPI-PUGE-AT-0066]|nr:longevity assurance proteins LAG1/LAC1 [Auriculariales sp. MPI-PUGE-AT-0066]